MAASFAQTLAALRKFHDIVGYDKADWILVGSTNLILQGVDVPASDDIDVMCSAEDCDKIAELLTAAGVIVVKPQGYSATEKYRSNFGVYDIDGVSVEIMGDFQYRLPDGAWSELKPMPDYEIFEVDGMSLRVLALAKEHAEYVAGGRLDKAEAISRRLSELG